MNTKPIGKIELVDLIKKEIIAISKNPSSRDPDVWKDACNACVEVIDMTITFKSDDK